jgi:hypothetical protein
MMVAKVKVKTPKNKQYSFKDDSFLYFLIFGCIGVLVTTLLYQKLTKRKKTGVVVGTWSSLMASANSLLHDQRSRQVSRGVEPSEVGRPGTFTSKGEQECRRYLETLFQVPFPKARPSFLKNPITGHCLEIDCFNESLRLGVEYNGQQHYSYKNFFHRTPEESMNQKYRDELKRRMCRDNKIALIEVSYTVKIKDIASYLAFHLEKLGYL